MEAMSQVKHASILMTMRGDTAPSHVITTSWSSKTERNRNVKSTVRAWALGRWKNQALEVDVTVLDTPEGGKITINGETEACCRFKIKLFEMVPVSALSVAGAR